jgi:hypothetical protein
MESKIEAVAIVVIGTLIANYILNNTSLGSSSSSS